MRGRPDADDDDKPAAEQMIRQCLESAAAPLRAVRLSDLHDLSPADLDDFYQIEALTAAQREWLAERIEARHAKSPKEVFHAIDDYLSDARSRA
jgi:hypothetical protein